LLKNCDSIETIILGIETSCDETGVALYSEQRGLIGHKIYSQIALHAQYGGVVPEIAARDHIRKLSLLVEELLLNAKVNKLELSGIAYTKGPGLIGALLVGASFAKGFAYALNIPAIAVHHLEGHILAAFLTEQINYPFLSLLVSGGHTQLYKVSSYGDYELLGETLDDAAGEAFDKTAKLLGLGYPGGPALAALATSASAKNISLPVPMQHKKTLDFSFSGLKTAVRRLILSAKSESFAEIAYAFEQTVTEALLQKTLAAIAHTSIYKVVIAGGVGANSCLRAKFASLTDPQIKVYYPKLEFCTDNGAMIAYAGYERFKRGQIDTCLAIDALARWPLVQAAVSYTK